jgi:hypothetical protein
VLKAEIAVTRKHRRMILSESQAEFEISIKVAFVGGAETPVARPGLDDLAFIPGQLFDPVR